MHLSDESIQRHLDGKRDPEVGEHLAVCLSCAFRAAGAADDRVRWERRGPLGRLVRVDA
jgi:hypothetical protein